jgi:hypothetical protein
MGMRLRRGALVAVGLSLCADALADEAPRTPTPRDATIFETSARYRFAWTEIPFRPDRPKAWDERTGTEVRASLRVLAGLFEGKLEVGMMSDRSMNFGFVDSDVFRGDLQLGINSGAWSYLLEWKGRDIFEEGFGEFITGLNTYDLRVKRRFALDLFPDVPAALVQASVAGGRVAASPHMFARNFGEAEIEAVQPLGSGFAILVAPKFVFEDFDDWPSGTREESMLSLRLSPSYNFGGGLMFILEGQAQIALSTRENKTGEIWSVTPILRFQTAL